MPALLETIVRFFTPLSRIASISAVGMPHRPKPPDMIVMPSRSSPARAAFASGYTLLTAIRAPNRNPPQPAARTPGAQAGGLRDWPHEGQLMLVVEQVHHAPAGDCRECVR